MVGRSSTQWTTHLILVSDLTHTQHTTQTHTTIPRMMNTTTSKNLSMVQNVIMPYLRPIALKNLWSIPKKSLGVEDCLENHPATKDTSSPANMETNIDTRIFFTTNVKQYLKKMMLKPELKLKWKHRY